MADEFLRNRQSELETYQTDVSETRDTRIDRMKALQEVIKKHQATEFSFTYIDGLAVRIDNKVYSPNDKDITPQSPDLNL